MSKPTDRAFPVLSKSQLLISLAILAMLLLVLTAKSEMKPTSSFCATNDCLIGPTIPISHESVPPGTPAMAIAYNSQNKGCLVVWQNKESNICWQVVLDSESVPDEHDFCILLSDNQQFPAVAYNSTNCQYLVVWQDDGDRDSIYPGWDIYGQLISCTPEPMGTPFPFFRPPGRAKDQLHPAVAYNSKKYEYLVVWEDKLCPSSLYTVNDIYGWRVDREGKLIDDDAIPISIATDCKSDESVQQSPAIAYNSQDNQYLVVWEDDRKSDSGYGLDIYGQVISTTGTLVGGNFPITDIDKDQLHPDLAYNSQDNLYLVVWQDNRYRKWDIYGRRVKSDGPPCGDFPISSSGSAKNPAVAYNGDHEYLVVWQDKRNGDENIYGQRVGSDDSLLGPECPISTAANDQEFPDVAYNSNSQNKEYMVVWQDGDDIYGQRVGLTPTHTPTTPTDTPTNTPTTVTPTPTDTPATVTPTPTDTPITITPTPTNTPITITPTPTDTPITITPTPTDTPITITPTPTDTPTTITPTPTDTPTTITPTPTDTPTTPTNTPTNTPRLYLPIIMKNYSSPFYNGDFETSDFSRWIPGGVPTPSVVDHLYNGDPPYSGQYCALLGEERISCKKHDFYRSWIYQDFTIPADAPSPTLTFAYRIVTNEILDWASFRVEIRDLHNVTLAQVLRDGADIYTCHNDLGWRSYSYDLSRFKGLTVRLWFESKNEFNGGWGIWTYVDDVTVTP